MHPRALLPLLCLGCASVDARPGPGVGEEDERELFRRARFHALPARGARELDSLSDRLLAPGPGRERDRLDLAARRAYRAGDAPAALAAARGLEANHRTRRILEALLARAPAGGRVFNRGAPPPGAALPLDPRALAAGLLVARVKAEGEELAVSWDTGASENVLSAEAAERIALVEHGVQFSVPREGHALVVRVQAGLLERLELSRWPFGQVPVLVTELPAAEAASPVDGFLSPQLLLPQGCFAVDKREARLRLGDGPEACARLTATCAERVPLYTWDGEVYVDARIHGSPEVALQLETGSPVTYLRTDAARWMPAGVIDGPAAEEGGLAQALAGEVALRVGRRSQRLAAIDLAPRRRSAGHDDLGSVGNDLLLAGAGFAVSFAAGELCLFD